MVEEIYTEELPETPPQTPQVEGGGGENTPLKSIFDELNPKYKIAKDYKEFEEFMKDKNNRKALFDELNPKAKIAKDFNEFEGFLNIAPQQPQPKEVTKPPTEIQPTQQLPITDGKPSVVVNDLLELRNLKKESNRVIKKVGQVAYGAMGAGGVTEGYDDPLDVEAKNRAKEKYLAAKKDIATQYNLKEDAVDFAINNLESYVGNNYILKVAKETNENPYAGERLAAAINYQIPLDQALLEKVKNNEITKGTYDDIWRNFLASQRSTTMSNSQKRDSVKYTLMLLREHLPYEQANQLSKYAIKDGANVYGNMGKGDIEAERQTIENAGELGDNAIRALAFLKDTDQNSYNKYIDAVIPKYALQTEEQILAWESKQKELEEIGLNLKYRRDAENLKNLENKIKKGDYTEVDLLQYNKAVEVNNENVAEFDKIKEKFPKAARYDLEFIAQELLGEQPLNEIGLFGVNLADNILDIPKGVGSLLSSPFKSKEEAQLDRLQTSGESKTNAVLNNRLESRKSSTNIGGVVEVLDSDIQAKIDEIKKSNNDYWYKNSQIKNLLSENPNAYTINKEKKKETNSFRVKLGSVSDQTSEVFPEILMALTGAAGARLLTGAKLGTKGQLLNNAFAEFTTSYQDNKVQTVEQGLKEGDALRRTIVQTIFSAVGDEFGAVMKAVRRLPKKYSSLFDNFTEKEFNKFLQGKAFSKLENIGLAVKDIAAGSAKTAAIGVGANIANDVLEGKDIDWSEKIKEFKDMAVDMGLLSTIARGIGAIKNFKDISDDRLLGIFDAATKPEEYKSILKTNVDNGKISKDDAINILNRIDAVAKVYNETSFTDVNGNLLPESKKIKMFGDVLRKNELVKESSTNVAPIRKEAIEKELGLIDERMNKLAEESPEQYIIDGKEVTKEEFIKTDLTDKKWRINNGDARLIERTIDKFGGAFDKTQLDSAYDKSNVKNAAPKQEESEESNLAEAKPIEVVKPTEEVKVETQPIGVYSKGDDVVKSNTFTRDDLPNATDKNAPNWLKTTNVDDIESKLNKGDKITFFAEKERNGIWDGKMIVDDKGTKWGTLGILSDKDGFIRNDSAIEKEQSKPTEVKAEQPNVSESNSALRDVESIEDRNKQTEAKIKNKGLFLAEYDKNGNKIGDSVGEIISQSNIAPIATSVREQNGFEFVEFSNPQTGKVDVIVTGDTKGNYVGFYRLYENGKPTNKWSSKMNSKDKNAFKTMMSGVQEMLPQGHEYSEKTSISTDGLRVWNQQLQRGYELQYGNNGKLITDTVAINGDALVNELGINVNQGNFDNIRVSNKEDFNKVKKALLPYLENFGLNESNINWVNGTVEIDLPVLKKSESLLSKEQSTSTTQTDIEAKKADIERRRQEELDKYSHAITVKSVTYKFVDDFEGGDDTTHEVKVDTKADGSVHVITYFEGEVANREIVTNKDRIADVKGLIGAKGSVSVRQEDGTYSKFEIKESTITEEIENTVSENKKVKEINAKYDAELKALEQKQSTSNVVEVGSVGVGGDVVTEKQQIKDFGVNENDVEPVHSVISQVFSGLKKAGLTAAKTVGDWVGIGKGGVEKPYTLKMNGKDVQVKNTSPDVVNGFYSPLEKVITESKFDKLPAKQWQEKYANSEEAKWTGLKDWLAQQQGAVSKADIQQYLKDNRIQVVEVVKGGNVETEIQLKDLAKKAGYKLEVNKEETEYQRDGKNHYDLVRDNGTTAFTGGFDDVLNYIREYEPAQTQPKFDNYQLEGEKENYKEVLVTMPQKTEKANYEVVKKGDLYYPTDKVRNIPTSPYPTFEQAKAESDRLNKGAVERTSKDTFKSSHFDEPNILVHLRMNTRTDAQGNKVLFLEEVQSDWGQSGKKQGFQSRIDYTELAKEASKKEGVEISKGEIEQMVVSAKNNWTSGTKDQVYLRELFGKERADEIIANHKPEGTPSAPFVTDTNAWTKLGLKVALKEAVKQGAEKIAWTTGEQQNDRYDLSKQVDYVTKHNESRVNKEDNSVDVTISVNNGLMGVVVDKATGKIKSQNGSSQFGDFKGKGLDEVIGKDVADRILKLDDTEHKLQGEGLKVGGKGMKGFYGSPTEGSLGIVGNVAKSLFKQEPKTVEIESGRKDYLYTIINKTTGNSVGGGFTLKKANDFIESREAGNYEMVLESAPTSTQHSIDITPELKASVENGQPLFKDAEAQYRIESGKNIVEAIKDFNGSPRATVALTHEIMHPTVVAIIDGAKEGNEVGVKHTKTIVDEFNKQVREKNKQLKLSQDAAENEYANSKLTEEDNIEQEPSIKAIESKAESNDKTELNEVIEQVDAKINAATDVKTVPLKFISTDEARFQNRNELNKQVVKDISENWSDANQDPIHVWTDPKDGKTYVLSGHHRYYGAKEAGRESVKIVDRTNDFTEAEAIKFAKEEANANRSMETSLERAKALREKIKRGDSKEDINKFLEREGKNKTFVQNVAALNPTGKAMQMLEQFSNAGDRQTQKETEQRADWIGEARRTINGLTDAHENEMFDFLFDKDASKRITTKSDFLQKVRSVVKPLEPNEPLNIARFKNKTQGEAVYDETVNNKKAEIADRQEKINAINDRFSNPQNKDYIPTDSKDYENARKIADNKISQLESERKLLQKQLEDIYRNKGSYTGASTSGTLFKDGSEIPFDKEITAEDLIKWNDDFKQGKTNEQYRAVQEFIAKAWEQYLHKGKQGFSAEFQKVLDQITQAFKAVYKSLSGKQLTPELRKMFDDILGKEQSLPTQEVKAEPAKQQTSAKPKEKAIIDVAKVLKEKTIFDKNIATDIADKLEGFADWLHNMDKGKLQSSLLAIPKAILEEASKGAAKILRTTNNLAKAVDHFIDEVKDYYKGNDLRGETEKLFGKYFGEKSEPIEPPKTTAKTNFLNDKNIPLTDEKIKALSADTSEYTGVKVPDELRESTKASLDLLQQEGAKWVAEAKEIYNNDNTTYVTKMIRAIKNVDGTTNLSVTKKAVAVVSLLESIDRDLMYVKLSKAERETMVASRNYLLGLRANLVKDVSLALNAQRLIYKMYNGKYKTKEVVGRMVGAEKAEFVDEVVANMEKFDVEITQDAIDLVQKEVSKPFESGTTTKAAKTAPITENQVTKNKKKYANILKNTVSEKQYEKLKNEIRDIAKKIICPQNKK